VSKKDKEKLIPLKNYKLHKSHQIKRAFYNFNNKLRNDQDKLILNKSNIKNIVITLYYDFHNH